jgi:hypothetical protein
MNEKFIRIRLTKSHFMFPDTTALDNTIYTLGDKEVNYPTYGGGGVRALQKSLE